ncbi:MAG TPA: hypothetical protein VFY23_14610 [Candidatus Limnocylindrales bacterium]|nr:hypothetical protein [Candidatus Limnocylindrales bacterium]
MTEIEIRAGEELERRMDRFARVRLDPSAAQAKRARAAVMEAAWRQRLGAPGATPAGNVHPEGQTATGLARARRRGPFAGWSPRRVGASLAAAVLAGLMVGTTAFAASRAGGPLYDVRVALEELTLPADAQARLEAELALAQGRLAEIIAGVVTADPGAVSASVRAYLDSLDDLDEATGGRADRAMAAILVHREILLDVLARAPASAQAGLRMAVARSSMVIARLDAAGTDAAPRPEGTGAGEGGPGAGTGSNGGNGGSGGNGGGRNDAPGATGGRPDEPGATGGRPEEPAATTRPDRTPRPAKTEAPEVEKPAKPDAQDDEVKSGSDRKP